ncbi:elongation factor G [Hyphomicrobium methylovorum]|uniref:elongation factor G n=1 Tax=Hyphomicrobium methylovorum TaxID=84 RepID=UPI0015E6D146|nr:elongation factor G [Hyphomicrobium methylovorum]MBA2127029.1 elongation factor G [Hyphomicrobium methylovorum]
MTSSDGPTGRNGAQGRRNGVRGARCIALIGPFASGKTTLLEAILARTGRISRPGSIAANSTVGDNTPEARNHAMSVGLNVASISFLDDEFTFIDCPGSVEFAHEGALALPACDMAVVVCEADAKRVPAVQLILKQLNEAKVPHLLFLNKVDISQAAIADIIPNLQPASEKPLVLRQIPISENGVATGFVDLASERAYVYRERAQSEIIELPKGIASDEKVARFQMLEKLADYDDELMEQLLSDVTPANDRVFDDLTKELKDGLICPVLIGSAERGNGILRLLKALRHECPFVDETAARLGLSDVPSAAYVFKSVHTKAGGKLSFVRVLTGEIPDGAIVTGRDGQEVRAAGIFSIQGEETSKRSGAKAGDTIALGRLDAIHSGETITVGKTPIRQISTPDAPQPVLAIGLGLKDRKDEVKLSAAAAKLVDEDPSLVLEHNADMHQILLHGQGEMHLRVSLERLQRKYGIEVVRERRRVGYKETIKSGTEVRGRHKKQSGGHGQFGDVKLDIQPLPRSTGVMFGEKITGGAIPRNFIPSVEIGVRDYLSEGPLGFPVVDVSVTLMDGSFHSVDSSDMAFRQAGRLAMTEGMPKCNPVLLEPIMSVSIVVPSESNARINGIISQRRGQILGFDARPEWPGWDVIQAHIPEAEMDNLIIDLRSATAGVGSFTSGFDHLAEVSGRLKDQVLAASKAVAA